MVFIHIYIYIYICIYRVYVSRAHIHNSVRFTSVGMTGSKFKKKTASPDPDESDGYRANG